MLQQIEYAETEADRCDVDQNLFSAEPVTISNYQDQTPWDLTIEECVELALADSKILQKLGGVVVSSPAAASTLFDQAITETSPQSVEAALSAFDAQVSTSLTKNRTERKFNNPLFGAGNASQISNISNFRFEVSKQTAAGTSFALRNLTDYNRNNSNIASATNPFGNRFASVYDMVNQVEVRQPLLRGRGTAVNRIAGPNAVPGQYNGVLIARIRSDISLTDFERNVRNLVRDVETNYWELYFAYRDLDTKVAARESARETWENRKLRYENGVGRPDEEAQARQQYLTFHAQAQNALTGLQNGQSGLLGSERNLRRLLGLAAADGRIIRPITSPAVAPVVFDWEQSQQQTLQSRVELRRQKWTVKQRELELVAAKSLNKWRFDLVGQYGFRGFGDDLFGTRSISEGSAFDDLINGDLDDWQVGLELGGAIGNRTGHLAIRNAELNLVRERAVLKEQRRQIIHDLNAAYTEVDRAQQALRTSFNSRIAVQEELEPKRKRVIEGQDQVFFLLDAEQRAATAESAVHRSIVDYNQALLNYSLTTGSLLARYNIVLSEGQWSQNAQQNAARKSDRFRQTSDNRTHQDVPPVTSGVYDQYSKSNGQSAYQGVSYQGDSSTEDASDSNVIDGEVETDPESDMDEPSTPEEDEGLDKYLPKEARLKSGSPFSKAKAFFKSR